MVKPRYYRKLTKNLKTYRLITYVHKVITSDEDNLNMPNNKFQNRKKICKHELTFELSKISSDQKIETKNSKTKDFGILITTEKEKQKKRSFGNRGTCILK